MSAILTGHSGFFVFYNDLFADTVNDTRAFLVTISTTWNLRPVLIKLFRSMASV